LPDTELYLIGTILTVLGGLAYSEWRIRRFRAHFTAHALQTLQDAFFEEEASKDGKPRLLRPNAQAQAFLSAALPGFIDWASKNVKIKLPAFQLPEGLDLKGVGLNAMAQKVMAGKKLKVDDAIPYILGLGKDYLDKSGMLEKIGTGAATVAKKKEELNPFLKELGL
jgi:hypothetical protein